MSSVKHKFVSGIADDPASAAAGEILPSHWNDEHSVSLVAADITALGFITSASVATALAGYLSSDSASAALATNALTVRGTATFSGTAFFLRDIYLDATGSTLAAPLTFGKDTFAGGEAVRWQFGDTANCIQNGFGQRMQITAYHGIEIFGGRADLASLSFTAGAAGADIGVLIRAPAGGGPSVLVQGEARFAATVSFSTLPSYQGADTFLTSNSASVMIAAATSGGPLAKTTGFSGVNFFKMSGDWSAYQALELDIQAKGAAATTNLIIALYTDGGTNPILTFATNPIASATASEVAASFRITGSRNQNAMKVLVPLYQMFNGVTNQAGQFPTSTFTTSAINAIGIITGTGATTTTMSSGDIFLYGRGA